jgi:protein required for attachment to host cells
MNSEKTWVLVANGSQAKLYRVVKFPKIEELTTFAHLESRLHNKDLVSNRPGQGSDRVGFASHSYEPPSDPHELELEKFAKDLGRSLSGSCQKGEFSRLYVMASPSFLGLLRPHLDQKTKTCIVAEVPKDMIEHTIKEIEDHLVNA